MQHDMLFEILTEELPPKALLKLKAAFKQEVELTLKKEKLSFDEVFAYATPRRLALIIRNLSAKQADGEVERKGPAVSAAYDQQGQPTKAALGFAKSCGITLDQASTLKTDKGEWLYYKVKQIGQAAKDLLPDVFKQTLKKLPIPKLMTWGVGDHHFIRPVKNILAMMGDECVPMTLFGVEAVCYTYGHRFHHLQMVKLNQAQDYVAMLREAWVMVDFDERREQTASHLTGFAESNNATVIANDALLDEVTSLVEWPTVLMGQFDEKYLQVPEEVLILSMASHQRYFALRHQDGHLLPQFVLVSNIKTDNPQKIIEGNQKVLHARFSDALFFFEQDKKRSLASRVEDLSKVLFQKQLGSLWHKTKRIEHLAVNIAQQLQVDDTLVKRAAQLCKTDLMTEMVGEFPELQGVMGRYYALHDGENPEVALALDQCYQPRFADDDLPQSTIAQCVTLADRIDTLVGIIGINKSPTGDKDPFALRRQALAILRILIENEYDLDLKRLIEYSITLYDDGCLSNEHAAIEVLNFIEERLKHYLIKQRKVTADIYAAASDVLSGSPYDLYLRVKALQLFLDNEASESLIASNKRVANILKKHSSLSEKIIDENLFDSEQERNLFSKQSEIAEQVKALVHAQDYLQALTVLTVLKAPVDVFFENVMVMADDEKIRNNRLALLSDLRALFLNVADISKLQV